MRIVGGIHRGRRLRVPPGNSTRPTTERVREALFNVLGTTVQGCAVLDVYAGSGALGIEALSRGARRAVFVEMAGGAASIVRENLANLSVTDPAVAQVVQRAIERSLDALRKLGPFDLCLFDPPFAAVRDGTALRAVELVAASGVLSPDATVVLEFPSDQPDPSLQGL
ncbi:MAG: 16S rRNA (guanine(966)-N(2))-methyltransferase RsmD, partial [Deltaproteobacteria bacterium HGW-Deltaproteobacteria-20]